MRGSGNSASADVADRIADRAASAGQKEASFGFAVSQLLKLYGFPDEDVVNAHYQASPRVDGMSWAQVLSAYRGGVIHIGYLELTSSAELLDVYRYVRHLHDILVRIVLTEIDYTGTYRSTVAQLTDPKPTNWVTASTPAAKLGYAG